MGKIVFAAFFIFIGDIAAALYLAILGDLDPLSILLG